MRINKLPLFLLVVLVTCGFSFSVPQQEQERERNGMAERGERKEMRQRLKELLTELEETFQEDPNARIALAELELPARLADGLDRNDDSFLEKQEFDSFLEKMKERRERRRGDRPSREYRRERADNPPKDRSF